MAFKGRGRGGKGRGGKGRGRGRWNNRGGNRGSQPQRKKTVPADFEVSNKRNTGKVVYFSRRNGFGFIKPNTDGLVPDDRIMVVWNEIQSNDHWPFLYKDLEVEFGITKTMNAKGDAAYLKASKVTLPGNKKVNLQEEVDAEKEFIHSKTTRFSGVVKWYDARRGTGIVTLDAGFAGVENVPENLRIVRNEINAGDDGPVLRSELKVEFGIQKSKNGYYSCYNLSMPGGKIVKRFDVEQRKTQGNTTFSGVVDFFNTRSGYGYIKPDNVGKFPAAVKTALDEGFKASKERLEKRGQTRKAGDLETGLFFRRSDMTGRNFARKGEKATFRLYTDVRGAGAVDVKIE